MLWTLAAERPRRISVVASVLLTLILALLLPRPAHAAAGRIRELMVPTANAHPGGVVLGSDGAVWFTEIATNAIGRLQGRTFTTFPLPQGGQPNAIEAGPDGALWFTEYSGGRIGRITTAGQISEFTVPLCNGCTESGPWDIAAGPDGALWFTELDANRIGRITTSGAITQFDLSAQESSPIGIANGPDGALWFTDGAGVGRIAVDGTAAQRWSGSSSPSSITTGPDGRLWFTESSSDQIGRLDPVTGQVKEFRIDLNCFPQEIASGSGSLWFTCYFLDEVGRVTIDGHVSKFAVPNHFGGNYPDTLEGIAPGAGNDMWFTEEAANRIGRISTS
jgi:virginiamycin B lyase